IRHYMAHLHPTWTIPWEDGLSFECLVRDDDTSKAEAASPYAPAYRVLRLLKDHNWHLEHPPILEELGDIVFDVVNKTFFEEQFNLRLRMRGEDPRPLLPLLWELVQNHLRTGGEKE